MNALTASSPPDPRFSELLPGLQLDVNSSSLGPFKICPRRYQYEVLRTGGKLPESPHLTFGTLLHEAIDRYEALRAEGADHEEALEGTLRSALEATWNVTLCRPWISGHAEKNRGSLLRTIVWYLDHWSGVEGYRTSRLEDGRLASELSFRFDSGFTSVTGEAISFIGRLDRIVEVEALEAQFVLDTKSTGYSVDGFFFSKFTPDNQFSLYALAGRTAFAAPVQGVLLDGVQIGATFSRFARGIIRRSEAQLDEWLEDAHWWLSQMGSCAERGRWPQNDKACGLFGGCPYRGVCAAEPREREFVLKNLSVQGAES